MIAPFGHRLILHVSFLKDPADGIGNGQNQTVLLENGMFAADSFELFHDLFHVNPRSKCQGTSLPMASVLAVVDLPDFPMVANTSKGRSSNSVTVT